MDLTQPVPIHDVLHEIRQALQPPGPSASSSASVSPMAQPATFSGEEGECSGFLLQCELNMEMNASRYFQPSTSPAAFSFFFVGKKDGGLRPCIDYLSYLPLSSPPLSSTAILYLWSQLPWSNSAMLVYFPSSISVTPTI